MMPSAFQAALKPIARKTSGPVEGKFPKPVLPVTLKSVIPDTFKPVIPDTFKPVIPAKAGIYALLAAMLLILLAAACGAEPTETTATPVPSQPTPAPRPTEAPAPTERQPAKTPPLEGHQPTAPAAPVSTNTPPPAASPEASEQPTPAPEQAQDGQAPPADAQELNVILATTVLEVGAQRVAFLLVTPTGLVKGDTSVSITPVYLLNDIAGPSVVTRFHQWPYGVRGAFAAEVDFDRAGPWRLDVTAEGPDGGVAAVEIEVAEDSAVPFIGSAGPLSENKTLSSAGAIELITTDYTPDLALYEVTIREAVESSLPAVVVFASPAFCTTATCGPQVDAVSELRETYAGQAHFIHVEIYDNPDEIQGDLDRARIAPTVDEWGLTGIEHWFNESWTFVLDADGRIHDRFEGFATVAELEDALQETLN